jgi:hypothetical protein
VFGDRPAAVLVAKAGVAFGSWRLGIHWAANGSPERARALRWVFLAVSAAAGAWNVSVSW